MTFAIIAFWLICGGIAAWIVKERGGDAVNGFLVGLLLGPLGFVAAFFMGNERQVEANKVAAGVFKKCPRCAELVKPDALVCKHCAHEFEAAAT